MKTHSQNLVVVALCSILTVLVITFHFLDPVDWPLPASKLLRSLHGPGFAIVAVLVVRILSRQKSGRSLYVSAALVSIGIAMLAEGAQFIGPRNAEFRDIATDLVGIVGALLLSFALTDKASWRSGHRTRHLVIAISTTMILAVCAPTIWLVYSLAEQRQAFPVLLTFDRRWENVIYEQPGAAEPALIINPENWPESSGKVALVSESGKWGVFLVLYPNRNWSQYSRLRFVAASLDDAYLLNVGIRQLAVEKGKPAPSYYVDIPVDKNPRELEINLDLIRQGANTRQLDLSRVEAIVFATSDSDQDRHLFLDKVRLEN